MRLFAKMSRHHENQHNATVLKYEGICITEDDLQCLKVPEYVNDNIINFWFKYMYETLLDKRQQERIHICDTHFIPGLQNNSNVESSHHLQRRMKGFEKDYVVIPVNDGDHWFLITWEYPRHAYNVQDFEELALRSRLRFHDSMGKDYLLEEKTKIYDTLTNFIRKAIALMKNNERIGDNPQIEMRYERVYIQKNSYDCGIHLLTNAERFILMAFDKAYNDIVQDNYVVLLKTSKLKRIDIKNLIRAMAKIQKAAEIQDELQEAIELS